MTVPRGLKAGTQRVTDMLRDMMPQFRHRLTSDEQRVGIYLRGNDDLLAGLRSIIDERIGRREFMPVPSNPLECKAMMERDHELRWLLGRFLFIHTSPVAQSAVEDESEQPA